jgi:hypothetical protein
LQVCTLITKDHLAYARVLARSVTDHEPGATFTVLCVDDVEGRFDPESEPFQLVTWEELELGDAWRMALRYGPLEFALALKPWLLRHLLMRDELVIYLDSDIRVYGSLAPLSDATEHHEIVLSPHLLAPLPDDGQAPSEPQILKGGAYNAGCLAVTGGDAAHAFLDWWGDRLRTGSRVDPGEGYMVDQRWLDLVAGLFEDVHLLRDEGCNVAYWNVATRRLIRAADGGYRAGESPLRFFHFSGFDPGRPRRLSKYDSRFADLQPGDPLAELCGSYASELEEAGFAECAGWPYSWMQTASGIVLTRDLRQLSELYGAVAEHLSPFTVDGERAWLAWLNEPVGPGARHGVSRYLAHLHTHRGDVSEAFPKLDGDDAAGYVAWAHVHGRQEIPVLAALLPPAPAGAGG